MSRANEEQSDALSSQRQHEGPLQLARSAVHGLNCTLDSIRGRVLRALPKPRNVFGQAQQRRALSQGRARQPVSFRGAPFAAAIPGDGVVEQVFTSGISSFLNLYNTVLIGRIILTWFPSAPPAIVTPLATITDPYLNLFRGIIPPLGGTLDLSPILAFVALDLFTNAAAALPCETGAGNERAQRERQFQILSPSQAAVALRRRLAAQRQRRQQQRQQQA